jgi:Fe-S cluster assembly scaffold protein SufB
MKSFIYIKQNHVLRYRLVTYFRIKSFEKCYRHYHTLILSIFMYKNINEINAI